MSAWPSRDNPVAEFAQGSPLSFALPLAVFGAIGLWQPPGPVHGASGALLVIAGTLCGLLVGDRLGMVYALASMVVFELAYYDIGDYEAWALPLELLRQVVRVFAAPLFIHVWMPARGTGHGLAPIHLYLPLAVTVPLTAFSVVRTLASPTGQGVPGIDIALIVFGVYYLAVFVIVLLTQRSAPETPRTQSERERAAELERSGRFAVASRVHARAGRTAEAADAAERGGDYPLAARLYAELGNAQKSGDMYYRIGDLEQAARQYTKAGAHAAVARVYERLGRPQDAAAAFERAGDLAGSVRALQKAGVSPGAEMLYRAGRVEEALVAWEAEGAWGRLADVLEHEIADLPRAAVAHQQAGQLLRAGELFERIGRTEEAIAAFAAAPDGQLQAIRLCLDTGQAERAEAMLSALPAQAQDAVQDEHAFLTLARLHEKGGRRRAAISLLQKARRLESSSGATRLLLGRLLLEEGLGELAEQELRAAAELPMDVAQQMEAAYLLGCVLEGQGRAPEACEIFAGIAQRDIAYRDVAERYRRLRASAAAPSEVS